MLGMSLALLCAFSWSVAVILLKVAGTRVHPIMMNLGKNVLGFVLLIPTALWMDGPLPSEIPQSAWWAMAASGFIGIGIADGLTLLAMRHLSATGIALLECLFAPFVIVLAVIFFNESVTLSQSTGGLLIGAALLFTLPKDRQAATESEAAPSTQRTILGSTLMALGLFTMAGGIMMVKPVFEQVPLFWIITVRMGAGVIGSLMLFGCYRQRRQMLGELLSTPNKKLVLAAFITSSYLAISLWIAGYKYLQAPLAAILNQTSTIFTVLLAVFILKERLTIQKVFATLLATAGVIMISVH